MFKEIEQTINELSTVKLKVISLESAVETFLEKEEKDLKNISFKETPQADSKKETISYSLIKNQFGKLFYGALCPLNGVSPANRRIEEMKPSSNGYAVWKKVGFKHSWSSRVAWYTETEVFDKLSPIHIDLMINGKRNRLNQIEMANDFLKARDSIKECMEVGKEQEIEVKLSKSIPFLLLFTASQDTVSSFVLKKTVSSVYLEGSELKIPLDFSPVELEKLKTNNQKLGNFSQGDSINYSLFAEDNKYGRELPQMNLGWGSSSITLLGIKSILMDDAIKNHFSDMENMRNKGHSVLQELQDKYSINLLMKGVF